MATSKKTDFAAWNWNKKDAKGMPLSVFAPPARDLAPCELHARAVRDERFAVGACTDPNLVPAVRKKIDACRDYSPFAKGGWTPKKSR